MHFATENLSDVIEEYGAFVYDYWHATPNNDGLDPLDFDWSTYRRMDEVGMLHLTIGRSEHNEMIAAALYIVHPDLKRRNWKIAHCDTFAVARTLRGNGIGRKLYEASEPALIALGVDEIVNGYREVYKTQPLFERLGFTCVERLYSKRIR